MGSQFYFTSARRGITGATAGLQFVAATGGRPVGLEEAVWPYMRYEAPPSTPPRPTRDEIAAMPVAFGYARDGDAVILTRCHYSGQDYVGRDGNYFGHAVHVDRAALRACRPVEFYDAPWWADGVSGPPDTPLDPIETLEPGDVVTPDAVLDLVSESPRALRALLARLLAETIAVVNRRGRLFVVGSDDEQVARIIGFLGLSVPYPLSFELTFVTYSGLPTTAPYKVIGTRPDVFLELQPGDVSVDVDDGAASSQSAARSSSGPREYADRIVEAWEWGELHTIDSLGELCGILMADGLRASDADGDPGWISEWDAATALALEALGRTAGSYDQDGVARLLARKGDLVPDWVWRGFAGGRSADDTLNLQVWRAATRLGRRDAMDRLAKLCVTAVLADRALLVSLPDPGGVSPAAAGEVLGTISAALPNARTVIEVVAMARLLAGLGLDVPGQRLQSETARCVRASVEPLEDVLGAVPSRSPVMREQIRQGVLSGLERAEPHVRSAVLTAPVLDWLGPSAMSTYPHVELHRIVVTAERDPSRRLDHTGSLFALARSTADDGSISIEELHAVLRKVWPRPSLEDRGRIATQLYRLSDATAALRMVAEFLTRDDIAVRELRTRDEYRLARELWKGLAKLRDEPVRLVVGLRVLRYEYRHGKALTLSARDVDLLLTCPAWLPEDGEHAKDAAIRMYPADFARWVATGRREGAMLAPVAVKWALLVYTPSLDGVVWLTEVGARLAREHVAVEDLANLRSSLGPATRVEIVERLWAVDPESARVVAWYLGLPQPRRLGVRMRKFFDGLRSSNDG